MKPRVSVITPTFNRANLLPRVWKSLKRQNFTNFQWIIVDDGSTDNTQDVVTGFVDPRITYVYQQNGGVNSARNRGEQEVQAEFVVFLDSDDELYAPNTLETMVIAICETVPEIAKVCFTVIDSEGGGGLFHMESERMEVDYVDNICEQRFWGEFFPIWRADALNISPWPDFNGLEAIRHWRIARHRPSLLIHCPARIYHRNQGDNLTGAASAVQRAPSMALAISVLIQENRQGWLDHCPCQLGRYSFYASMYYALSGAAVKALVNSFDALRWGRWTIRLKCCAVLVSLLLPTVLRRMIFLKRAQVRQM